MRGRRYFTKALDAGDARAALPLAAWKKLYEVEEEVCGREAALVLAARKEKGRPVHDALLAWERVHEPHEPPFSTMGMAIGYLLGNATACGRDRADTHSLAYSRVRSATVRVPSRILISCLALISCLVELPPTSFGFKCAEDRDCFTGGLVCVAGVCASRGAVLEDGGVDGGIDGGPVAPVVWRLAGYTPDHIPTAFHHEVAWRGKYSSEVIQSHAQEFAWAHINGGVIGWAGPGTNDDPQIVLSSTEQLPLRWALLYTGESDQTPSALEVAAILNDAKTLFAQRPNYLWLDGAFVFFVAESKPDAGGCDVASRWVQGNRMSESPAFLVLVAPGEDSLVARCRDQPSAWRLAGAQPLGLTEQVATLTPGQWPWVFQTRPLTREVVAFDAAVRAANDGRRRFQYVNSFNFWKDGTAVESGYERTPDGGVGVSWASDSGMGAFLDVLHAHPPVNR